jgi:SAM-dependent MidA family methyltransferase
MRDGKLREIYVGEKGGTFSDILADPSSAEIPRYLDDLSIRLEEGQHAEINLEAVRWLDHVDRVLKRGFLLTIDYGFLAEDLYGPARFMGTMLCYYRHGYSDDPYIHIGVQDITAHVNFSSLIRKGESLGFHLTGLVPQYQFLLSLGFLEEMERLETTLSTEEALAERLTMKNLILPDGGMGDTFKVLIQHRGVYPVQLSGLRLL